MADVVEHLLHDEAEWKRRSAAGLAFVEGRTWDHAARQTEAGLREALRLRQGMSLRAGLARRLRGAGAAAGGAARRRSCWRRCATARRRCAARAPRRRDGALRVALVIPQFRRGSGGHKTIADLVRGLEDARPRDRAAARRRGGPPRRAGRRRGAARVVHRLLRPGRARTSGGSATRARSAAPTSSWRPAGRRSRRSCGCAGAGARAYLVQDHEPEFYATSIEREWAAWTYRQGLHAICASPWLAELVTDMYGSTASSFDLGVDHDTYRNAGARAQRRPPSCSTRARRRRAARSRSRCWRWRSCTAAARRSTSRSSARRARSPRRSPTATSAS